MGQVDMPDYLERMDTQPLKIWPHLRFSTENIIAEKCTNPPPSDILKFAWKTREWHIWNLTVFVDKAECFQTDDHFVNTFIDINECERDTHECDGNATCTNTIGDYNCTCNVGFNGNGSECQGEVILIFPF